MNCFILKNQFFNQISLPAMNGTIHKGPFAPKGIRAVRPEKAVLRAFRKASLTVEAAACVPIFFLAVICLISIMDIYRQATETIMELRTAAETSALIPGSEGRITLSLPVVFTPLYLPEGPASKILICTASVHAWSGRTDEETAAGDASNAVYVYVAENGTVYHTSPTCTHLNLSIRTVSGSTVEGLTNEYGEHYHACEKCVSGDDPALLVYVTDYGNCYHNSSGCSGLKRTVRLVELSTLEGMGLCSRCAAGT